MSSQDHGTTAEASSVPSYEATPGATETYAFLLHEACGDVLWLQC